MAAIPQEIVLKLPRDTTRLQAWPIKWQPRSSHVMKPMQIQLDKRRSALRALDEQQLGKLELELEQAAHPGHRQR